MLRIRRNCNICILIKTRAEPDLQDRINKSKLWVPGGESLLAIWRDIGDRHGLTNQNALYNHAKKHQAPTNSQLSDARTSSVLKTIKDEGRELRKIEYTNHTDARRTLLEAGLEALESGDMKLTGNVIASLLKQEADIEEKSKDRSLELMKMFNYFASGANLNPNKQPVGPTNRPAFDGEVIEEAIPRVSG